MQYIKPFPVSRAKAGSSRSSQMSVMKTECSFKPEGVFYFLLDKLHGIPDSVMSDTLKQRRNAQTVCGRPTFHLSVNLNHQCSHSEIYVCFFSAISVFMIFL